MIRFVTGLLILIFLVMPSKGQLSSRETLNTVSFCDVSSMSLDCSSDIVAIQSVTFAYDPACESTCCSHDSTHCMQDALPDDTEYVRRACSGYKSCNIDLRGVRSFCAAGTKQPSYATVYYQCIPQARISSICSSRTLSSAGSPLYLTNENYPSVTTGDSTCSCSLEVYACSSNINIYIIDADLYFDKTNCNQRLGFLDATNASLKNINCESYYGSPVVNEVLNTHYMTINFLDEATQDQEGYFLLGFEASGTNTEFSLSCTAAAESWCVDCGALQSITFGSLELDDPGNSGYQAEATVNCNSGYQANSPKVTCLENATWEVASCSPKDCGSPPTISFGTIELDDPGNTVYQANASVTCNSGYESTAHTITCLDSATWELAVCSLKDCGSPPNISFGTIELDNPSQTVYQAKANVICDSGYETNSSKVTCLESAAWEVAVCSLKDENTGNETEEEDKKKDGGLDTWIIVVICLGFVIIISLTIGIFVYKKFCKKSITDTPASRDVDKPPEEQIPISSQPKTASFDDTGTAHNLSKKPLPEITKPHEIKHGHIYIDHGEAHIFGLTIHLPFAGKSANQLEPIER